MKETLATFVGEGYFLQQEQNLHRAKLYTKAFLFDTARQPEKEITKIRNDAAMKDYQQEEVLLE